MDAFLLRSLSVSGYGMALDDCARCGSLGPTRRCRWRAGAARPRCRPRGAASASIAAVSLLADLLHGDWAEAGGDRHAHEAGGGRDRRGLPAVAPGAGAAGAAAPRTGVTVGPSVPGGDAARGLGGIRT